MSKKAIVAVGAFVLVLVCGLGAYKVFGSPQATAEMKLSVKNAQLNFANAQTSINSSDKYRACLAAPACVDFLKSLEFNNYIAAQAGVQNTVQAVFSQAKADPTVWQLDPNLDFAKIPKSVVSQVPASPALQTAATAPVAPAPAQPVAAKPVPAPIAPTKK